MDIRQQIKPGLRAVFFVSDRTGLTAETYGRNLLAQFPQLEFETFTLAFVSNEAKARHAVELVDAAHELSGLQPIVISSLVKKTEQQVLDGSTGQVIDLFHTFLGPLEASLGMESAHKQGISKSVLGQGAYQRRLDAIDYSLSHDDGVRPDQYDEADVILVGVSRCGKTPTSLYLAMNFSLKVSNYPLTEEDLAGQDLPAYLHPHLHKMVAFTIKPAPLSKIRRKRRPNSDYASLANCQREIGIAEGMFERAGLPQFDTTETSIEEVASHVVKTLGISRERTGYA
jgi:regulator of PEP synthase PpsR (kinase-PPPase family)